MRNDSQEGDDDECQQNRSGREAGETLGGKIIFGCPRGKIIFRCLGGSYMSTLATAKAVTVRDTGSVDPGSWPFLGSGSGSSTLFLPML